MRVLCPGADKLMGKKYLFLFLILMALVGLSGGYIVGGTQAYSRYQQNTLANQEHCGGQPPVHICVQAPQSIFSAFYPSYVAAQYPLFTVSYSSSRPVTLLLSVAIDRVSQVQTRTVNVTGTMQSSTFIPALQGQVLRKLTMELNTALHVEARDSAGHLYYINDIPLLLHSRWLMQWVAANRLRIAAWVTPDDPAIAALVRKAQRHLRDQPPPVPPAMVGYNGATAQQVADQVDALYDTLRLDYHIHYIQASVPYTGTAGGSAATQNVRLPAEVLQQGSGMCVELTTLLASAAERIGINTEIVIIPGHAFLGVAVTPDNRHFQYWDAVDVDSNVAADSANVAADNLYQKNLAQHTILDTISISDARNAQIGPML